MNSIKSNNDTVYCCRSIANCFLSPAYLIMIALRIRFCCFFEYFCRHDFHSRGRVHRNQSALLSPNRMSTNSNAIVKSDKWTHATCDAVSYLILVNKNTAPHQISTEHWICAINLFVTFFFSFATIDNREAKTLSRYRKTQCRQYNSQRNLSSNRPMRKRSAPMAKTFQTQPTKQPHSRYVFKCLLCWFATFWFRCFAFSASKHDNIKLHIAICHRMSIRLRLFFNQLMAR